MHPEVRAELARVAADVGSQADVVRACLVVTRDNAAMFRAARVAAGEPRTSPAEMVSIRLHAPAIAELRERVRELSTQTRASRALEKHLADLRGRALGPAASQPDVIAAGLVLLRDRLTMIRALEVLEAETPAE